MFSLLFNILFFSLLIFSLIFLSLIILKLICAISCSIKLLFVLLISVFWFFGSVFSFSSSSSLIGWSLSITRLGKASISFFASSPVSIFIFNCFKEVNSVRAFIVLSKSNCGFALISKLTNEALNLNNSFGNSDNCLLLKSKENTLLELFSDIKFKIDYLFNFNILNLFWF